MRGVPGCSLGEAWAPPLLFAASLFPEKLQGSLRAGHWHTVWITAIAVTTLLMLAPLRLPILAGLVSLPRGDYLSGWYVLRALWLWGLLVTLFSRIKDEQFIVNTIRIVTLLQLEIAWFQITGQDYILNHSGRPIGLMDNTINFGCWLTMAAPFLMKGKWWWLWAVLVVTLFPLNSWGAIVGVTATSLFYLSWTRGAWKKILVALLFVGLFLGYNVREPISNRLNYFLNFDRVAMWKMTIKHGLDKDQWLGHGLGSFHVDVRDWAVPAKNPELIPWTTAHNDYLEAWYEGGWIAIFSNLLLGLTILLRLSTIPPVFVSGLFGYLLSSTYAIPWHVAGLWLFGALLVGVALRKVEPC